jgi:hypothetical protein
MATPMFRIRRCFNNSTSERPDDLLLVVSGVASAKRDADDDEDDGLEIETTSPNFAEDAEELFRFIGVMSPNCTPGVGEEVTFAMALLTDKDSSLTFSPLSKSPGVEGLLEYNRRDRGRLQRDNS